MKKILLILLLFSVSCTPTLEDLIGDLSDYEEEEEQREDCESPPSPPGNHPEQLIGEFICGAKGLTSIEFYRDGTAEIVLESIGKYLQDFWNECPDSHPRGYSLPSEWTVNAADQLCIRSDSLDPRYHSGRCGRMTSTQVLSYSIRELLESFFINRDKLFARNRNRY